MSAARHLSPSNDAGALTVAFDKAVAEAERLHGPLDRKPTLVTDNELRTHWVRADSDPETSPT